MNVEYTKSIWSLDKDEAIRDIKQLEIGESTFYPESDYGHGYIVKTDDGYECWGIPMYGGEGVLEDTYKTAEEAFAEVLSWT